MHKNKYANDPDYIYLMNAAAICDGKSVGHIDNPGTTVMQIGAASFTVKHFLSNPQNDSLVEHILKKPDEFIRSFRNLILGLNTLIITALGWLTFSRIQSIGLGLLLQSSVFITANTLDHIWTKMSPEPVLFFVSCIYVIVALLYYKHGSKDSWKYVFFFALITGAGLATKATFLPLVIFPLFVVPTFKKKIAYLAGIISSFILFTIPAITEYDRMYLWFRRLIRHSGKYGQGEKELIDVHTYIPNILKILENNLLFAIIIGVGILCIVYAFLRSIKKNKVISWDVRFLTGLITTSIFGILLVAKQYNGNHYLIPILLLSGIISYFIVSILLKENSKLKERVLSVFALLLIAFLVVKQTPVMKNSSAAYQLSNMEIDSVNIILRRDYPDYTPINYYSYSLNKFTALKFGDVYTKNKLLPRLMTIYPEVYFYDPARKKFLNWDTPMSTNELIKNKNEKLLMINGPFNEKTAGQIGEIGFPLKRIYKGRVQIIYKYNSTVGKPETLEDQ